MTTMTGLQQAVEFFQRNRIGYFPIWGVENSSCACGQDRCSSPGKHPFLARNWKKVAKTKPRIIEGQNVGVACGDLSGAEGQYLVVVDVDSVNNPGAKSFVDSLPKSFSYSTGKPGGKHIWFWSSKLCRNSVGKPYPGIDIRGNGGYVVAPPSVHVKGAVYGDDSVDWGSDILPMPKWLEDKIQAVASDTEVVPKRQKKEQKVAAKKALPLEEKRNYRSLTKIPEGQRNHALCYLLGYEFSINPLMANHELLLSKALDIHKNLFENPETYEISAVEKTVKSLHRKFMKQVLKEEKVVSAGRGVSHRDVHQGYVNFCMAKANRCAHTVEELQRLDDAFFGSLTVAGQPERYLTWFRGTKVEKVRTNSLQGWTSLETISQARDDYFRGLGYTSFSRYSLPLLAAKLYELGYTRCLKNDVALWNVGLSLTSLGEEVRVNVSTTEENEESQDMTVKVSNSTTEYKVTRKSHPEEKKYPGFVCWEVNNAINQMLECLTAEEFRDLSLGTLVYDEESTAEMFDSIQVGDVIGVVTPSIEEGGHIPRQYVVLATSVEGKEDTLLCEHRFFGKTKEMEKVKKEITFENVSCSMAIGFFHILQRDGKPFGLTEADELTIKVIGPAAPSLEDTLAAEAEEAAAPPV